MIVKDKNGLAGDVSIWKGNGAYENLREGMVYAIKDLVVSDYPAMKPHNLKSTRFTQVEGNKIKYLDTFQHKIGIIKNDSTKII